MDCRARDSLEPIALGGNARPQAAAGIAPGNPDGAPQQITVRTMVKVGFTITGRGSVTQTSTPNWMIGALTRTTAARYGAAPSRR